MVALSLKQPWAWLIVHGYKDIENRPWICPRRFLGKRIGIHASKTFDKAGYDWVRAVFPKIPLPLPDRIDIGGLVGSVVFLECVNASASSWFEGPWGFVLQSPIPYPLQPCRGQLGFFEPKVLGGGER